VAIAAPIGPYRGINSRFRNTFTTAPITVRIVVYNQAHAAEVMSITNTSSGDDVVDDMDRWIGISPDDGVGQAALTENALITSGPGGRLLPDNVWASDGPENYGATWDEVTVDPGQTVLLMSFMVEAPASEREAVAELAERLSLLTEPDALAGLTAAEKAAIVNFGLPVGVPTSGSGTGLTAAYYNGMDPTGTPILTRVDPTVDFDWADGSPDAAVPTDEFSARWTGQVQAPVSGFYRFATGSDDGVRLSVGGQLLIDNWTDHGYSLDGGDPIYLEAGQKYDVNLEFYENGGAAVIRLFWSYPGRATQAIPQSQLYPSIP